MGYGIVNTVEENLSEKLAKRVIDHRNRYYRLITSTYMEMLPICISYKNADDTAIDFLKLEVELRGDALPVIGELKDGTITYIGRVTNDYSSSNPVDFKYAQRLTEKDIDFYVPRNLCQDKMYEIIDFDDCKTGNFIVVRNKALHYTSDIEKIAFYAESLAEVELSIFSLILQAKLNTIVKGNIGDETITQIVTQIYNGAPYIHVSKLFDEEENLIRFENPNIANNIDALNQLHEKLLSKLNQSIGIQSLSVDKASGVSDIEAQGNSALTKLTGNVYVKPRNQAFARLNKRFNRTGEKEILATFDTETAEELANMFNDQPNRINNGGDNNS